ncbi:MAG: ABC transporter permease [Thaumarchaeota archaeon]|nr:ABC transporter permease [Nitrososphaerota archaeon]
MGLGRYVARRALNLVVLLLVIVGFNFVLFQIVPFTTSCPGLSYNSCVQELYVPVAPAKGGNASAIIEHERAQVISSFGFDQPLTTRFFLYFVDMFTGQYGYNIGGLIGGPVSQTVAERTPYTVLLLGTSTIAAFVIGIGVGVLSAAKRGKIFDVGSLAVFLFINSLPVFFVGGILIILQIITTHTAYVNLGTLTLTKYGLNAIAPTLRAMWLPFLSLTLVSIGGVYLTMRATMIDVLSEDYIVMARAEGLDERNVLYRHAFRNAVIPIATLFALSIGFILGGAVITEAVFDWPGLGSAIYGAVVTNDFPLEQAMFFIISLMVLAANFVVDVAYGFLDPRIKAG